MTAERDIARLLDAWLADGPMRVSDRAFDEAVGRVSRQRQRPAWRFQPWRLPTMSTQLKLVLAGAALLGAMLGATVLFSGGSARPDASPTTSPTSSPTALATTTPTLKPFRLEVQGDAITWQASVPERWSDRGWFVTTEVGPEGPTGIAVAATGAVNIPSDPCDAIGKVSVSKSAADVVAELQARDDLIVSTPTATTLGGYSGSRVDVQVPADLSACDGAYVLFAEPDGSGYYAQGPSNLLRIWILDVDGRPVIFWIQSFPGTPPADLAEAQQIMDSIVITP